MKRARLAAVIAAVILAGSGAARGQKLKNIFTDDTSGAPVPVWTRSLPGPIAGVAMAAKTGEAAYGTETEVFFMKDGPEPAWSAGKDQGWKLIQDLAVSWDGGRVFFQTDVKPKVNTESKTLTLHLLDGAGGVVGTKDNPMRYQNITMSPSGKYLLMGEATQMGVTCFDASLNQVWQKDIRFWYLNYDPLEHYLFDGEGGQLYKVTGEQSWDFGSSTRVNSLSDDANYLLTSYYRTITPSKRMFLTAREALKKVELAGEGGAVSRDGTLTAYVSTEGVLGVYRTADLLAGAGAAPGFKTPFKKPYVIQFARDNQSLFVLGQADAGNELLFIDLAANKISWHKRVDDNVRIALPTDDNRFIVVKTADNTVTKFKAY
jgi:hypothetical protein